MVSEPAVAKARELGRSYIEKYYGCSQTTLAAVADALGLEAEEVFKAMIGLAGGAGLSGDGTCGAVSGAIAAISLCMGVDRASHEKDPERRFAVYKLAYELVKKFKEKYGSIVCRDIQRRVHGRVFDLWNDEERKEFIGKGLFRKCGEVTGDAAGWAAEIILESGCAASERPS